MKGITGKISKAFRARYKFDDQVFLKAIMAVFKLEAVHIGYMCEPVRSTRAVYTWLTVGGSNNLPKGARKQIDDFVNAYYVGDNPLESLHDEINRRIDENA